MTNIQRFQLGEQHALVHIQPTKAYYPNLPRHIIPIQKSQSHKIDLYRVIKQKTTGLHWTELAQLTNTGLNWHNLPRHIILTLVAN